MTSAKHNVDEVILRDYLQHLQFLEINKRKRTEARQLKMQQASNRNFEDYGWFELLNNGLLKKLKVPELNKYLNHCGMKKSLNL